MATRPVDEKIVVMKLDNSDFKQKAVETTSLFGKLKESLNKIPGVNLSKTTQELSAIGKETSNINMDKLGSAVSTVASRFSTLGIVGVTALTNITNRAVDAGLALAKNLSVDQIMDGFREYETKIGSIQTILANTQKYGTTVDDVTKSLNELNDYADKTIYNFGDMTRNIGLFTNAGLKLEESTSMIKGFSNAAAASGSQSYEASRAAYQLSQGLSSGYIMAMDWMSLTNAGMGNDNMKRDLIALGQAMGTLNTSTEYTIQNWKETLSEDKWLTADVMSKYLQAMAGDLDKATLKTIGLTDAQADLLLSNAKTGEEAATKVRTFTQLMDTLKESIGSGWAQTFELIFGDFEEATVLWSKLSDTLGEVASKSANARNELLQGVKDKGGIQNIFEGIANAAIPVVQIFKAVGEGFDRVFPPMSVDRIVALTQSFKEFTSGLTLSQASIDRLTTISQGLFSIFSTVWEIAKRLTLAFVQLIPEGAGSGLLNLAEKLAKLAIGFNESVKQGNGLTKFIDGLGSVLGTIGNYISEAIGKVTNFSGSLRNDLGGALDWIVSKLEPVGQYLKETFSGIGGDDILGAGALVGIIAIIKKVMGFFDSMDFGGVLSSVKNVFEGVGDTLNNFATGVKYANLILIATAVGILAVSLKTLEGINTEDLVKGITSLATALGVMIAGMVLIEKFNVSGGLKVSATLIAVAASVSIMASALKKIADLQPQQLAVGIGGLVAVTAALSAAVIAISAFGGKIGTSSLQLIALATAVTILASAVETMSAIDSGSLFKSIGALGLIFAELAIFLKVVNGSKLSVTSALGIVAVAGAIQLIVKAISSIQAMDVNTLVKGLTTLGIILGQIAIFSQISSGPTLLAAGAGILMISGAINALVGPLTTLGSLSWEELLKGLGGMAVALVSIAGAAALMSGSLAGVAGVVLMATALNMIIGPIQSFANMTWEELIRGFVGLAGGLTLIAGAALLLSPAVAPMLAFSAGLLAMGVAILAAGAGMALFGTGLAALATLTATSVAAIVSALGLLLKGFGELIPAVVGFVVKLGVALLDGIAALVPKLANTVVGLITSLLEVISTHLPKFIELGVKIIAQLIVGIGEGIPTLVDAGVKAIVALVQGLADAVEDNGPQLVSAILDLMGEIILLIVEAGAQTVNALLGWIPGVKAATEKIGSEAEEYIRKNFGAKEVAKEKGIEFSNALKSTSPNSKASGTVLGNAAKEGIGVIDTFSVGEQFGINFASGISSKKSTVSNAASGLALSASNTIGSTMQIHSPSKVTTKQGEHVGQGYANGISKKQKAAEKAAKKVATAAKKALEAEKKKFEKAMDDAEYEYKMENIDSAQYIKELEKIKKAYAKYPDWVKKVNLEIKKIEDDMLKAKQERMQKEYDASKSWIDRRKALNKMSLAEELAAYERMMSRYAEGTEQRMAAEKEVYNLKNEINSKIVDLNDDYVAKVLEANEKLMESEKQLNEEYENALNERTKSLASFAGLFDAVTKASDVSGQQLMTNLRDQVMLFADWASDIQSLTGRGLDAGLIDELREMGPKAAGEIKALTTLTESELAQYSNLWLTKNQMARSVATEELEGLKQETASKIEELRKKTAEQLEVYKDEWLKSMGEIRNGTASKFVDLNTTMQSIGNNAIKGLQKGMADMKGPLLEQAKSIAKSVEATIKNTLQIKSPSRKLMALGEYGIEGLIVGMANMLPGVVQSAKDVANTAEDSLNKFLYGLTVPDNEIRISAVIDYDELDTSRFKMATMNLAPDLSYSQQSLNDIKQDKVKASIDAQRETINQQNDNGKIDELISAVVSLVNKPSVTQLQVDGRQMAEVVSGHQYSSSSISAYSKGVVL